MKEIKMSDRTVARHARLAAIRRAATPAAMHFATWDTVTDEISTGMVQTPNVYDNEATLSALDEAEGMDPGTSVLEDHMAGSGVAAFLSTIGDAQSVTLMSRKQDPLELEMVLDYAVDAGDVLMDDVWDQVSKALADFHAYMRKVSGER